ncbi:MAG: TRAP transporter substrate-binding protein DctP [Clostridiales bacterium]|nr:TRAP transporter substrate-binding protein DctP [Clostridiales bacterium]
MKRRVLAITMCVVLLAGAAMLTACGDNNGSGTGETGQEVWNLRLSSQNPVEFADSVMMAWAVEEIYDRTDGAINITHFPAGVLGDYIPILQEVIMGTVDIIVGTAPTTVDSRMAMLYIPYLVTSYEEGRRLWTHGSNFFDIFSGIAEDNNLELLAILPGGLMGIGTREPLNPATKWDFDVEKPELRLRLPPLWILQSLADGMQFTNTHAIPFADLYPALMTGVVDGWLGGGPELNYVGFRDAINYYYDYRYMDDSFVVFMNKRLYDSLPAHYSRIISEVMEEAALRMMDEQTVRSADFIDRLKDYGITVFQPTDAEREAMREAAIRRIWPGLYEEFGEETMLLLHADVAGN